MNSQAILFLFFSIAMEVVATTALKYTEGFTRTVPSVIAVICYGFAFYSLTIPMKTIPVGVIYAVWSGAGIFLISLVSWIFMKQKLDAPAVIGLLLIISGVVFINLFSRSVSH
ncbi:QacE family quaternary ammonium compound efflux SMR transporter [Enterobacter quasiroggenkampii]|nr:QacE family quaternary ammonium compound efflux SMR transporter [Enterobacter quasiroggenkampii]